MQCLLRVYRARVDLAELARGSQGRDREGRHVGTTLLAHVDTVFPRWRARRLATIDGIKVSLWDSFGRRGFKRDPSGC